MAPLDDLKQLANASGGLFFYVSDHDGVQGLLVALKEALELAKSQVWDYIAIQLWFPLQLHSLSCEMEARDS